MKNKLTGAAVALGAVIVAMTLLAPEARAQAAFPAADPAFTAGEQAHLVTTKSQTEIRALIAQPERYTDSAGTLYVSVEVPKRSKLRSSKAELLPWSNSLHADELAKPLVQLQSFAFTGFNMPPGPNTDTTWLSFSTNLSRIPNYSEGPLLLRIPLALDNPTSFARVLIGRPSTPRSIMIGAFPPNDGAAVSGGTVIQPGVDYLGTLSARQHFRIPANTLAPGTDAFDEMVEFGDAPFEPAKSNIDTVMLRLMPVRLGGTTPVRLLRFANRSKKPIKIHGTNGDLYFTITARLSPNARSGGFVTILPDGTYRSTTSLTPILEFQPVQDGRPSGAPIVVDTAVTPIPGFPFYLASTGGRWSSKAPANRVTNAMTSNFFYANGVSNAFVHSNGPGAGILGKCAKLSAQFTGVAANRAAKVAAAARSSAQR